MPFSRHCPFSRLKKRRLRSLGQKARFQGDQLLLPLFVAWPFEKKAVWNSANLQQIENSHFTLLKQHETAFSTYVETCFNINFNMILLFFQYGILKFDVISVEINVNIYIVFSINPSFQYMHQISITILNLFNKAYSGCAGQVEIAILPQFLAIEPHFVRKGCVSCCLVGTAPAPAFRREIEKKEKARGQEGKRRRCEAVRMWRCEDEQMWRCEDEKIWRWADVKMWRWAAVKVRRCEDEKMWRWDDVKMRRCEDEKMWSEKMWRWEDVKMRRCEDEKMWRWEDVNMRRWEDEKMSRWEDVKMRRCEDEKMWSEKMWRWEDVKMRRREDEKVWRWEGAKMRRWDTDPHYWKNPALRRSREKSLLNKHGRTHIILLVLHTNSILMIFL